MQKISERINEVEKGLLREIGLANQTLYSQAVEIITAIKGAIEILNLPEPQINIQLKAKDIEVKLVRIESLEGTISDEAIRVLTPVEDGIIRLQNVIYFLGEITTIVMALRRHLSKKTAGKTEPQVIINSEDTNPLIQAPMRKAGEVPMPEKPTSLGENLTSKQRLVQVFTTIRNRY